MLRLLARKLLGDRRPIDREVLSEQLGVLRYSDDDDAWLTDKVAAKLAFNFYIAGSDDPEARLRQPDQRLIAQAERVAADQDALVAEVLAYVGSECANKRIHRGWEQEIAGLQVETLCLFWPKKPREGQISLSGGRDFRLWRCGYIDGHPGGGLAFDS
jgi:hypothetical protein